MQRLKGSGLDAITDPQGVTIDREFTRNIDLFVAQWLACTLPCQRFTYGLTTARA